jgi:glycosyltransferase involved in cell wall biosynthesis
MRTWTIPRAVVIATHDRPAELRRAVEAIAPQVDVIVVIDNASDPPIYRSDLLGTSGNMPDVRLCLVHDDEQPPNLSRLWNVGLERAELLLLGERSTRERYQWDVAVLNDDAIPPPGWFDAVAGAMRQEGCVAGSSYPFEALTPDYVCVHRAGPPSIGTRLAGWAMMLRGEWDGARFDERLRWWFSDDLLSLRAREAGGLVHVGGYPVPNTGADSSTVGVLAEQAGRDRATFIEITGRQPW